LLTALGTYDSFESVSCEEYETHAVEVLVTKLGAGVGSAFLFLWKKMETPINLDAIKSVTDGGRIFQLATEEYEALVKACAEMELAIDIPNRLIDHAAILENYILRFSTNNVDVLTGSFPDFFYGKICKEFDKALSRDVTIRIIATEDAPSRPIQELRTRYSNLKIFTLPKEMRDIVRKMIPHFMVSDRKRYRLEEKHEMKNFQTDPEIKATACFNNPRAAEALHATFNRVVELADPLN